jgi:RNA polymerase sigma-70 factor (ECF subfamily)
MTRDATGRPDAVPAEAPREPSAGRREVEPDALAALVREAAAGQRGALARLMALVAPAVSSTVRVFLGRRPTELEDALQESLIAIAEALPRFRAESSFFHYCRRIAVRVALAHRAASRRRDALVAELPEGLDVAGEDGFDGVEREQLVQAFQGLLDELPAAQAESLAYRVVLEEPLPVIARETGVPVNTVRSRIRLARNYLRERIDSDPELRALLKETP